MTDFLWPSDLDRSENDELARVCEHLETVMDERDAALHEVKCLADAIQAAAVKAGIINAGTALTGPMLMLLCDDLVEQSA